jgi:hypothetical protein
MFFPLMKQYLLVSTTGMVILVNTSSLVDRTSVQHDVNTSQYRFISGENISTTGMVILVSTASLVERTSVQQEW